MTTEEGVRRALSAIADLAPDPDPVRRRMAARIRSHRQRRVLLVAGAGAASLAAVGVPVAIVLSRGPQRPPGANLPDPGPEPSSSGNLRVRLRLRPTWLPEDLREVARFGTVNGVKQGREWFSAAALSYVDQNDSLEKAMMAGILSLSISHPVQYIAPPQSYTDPASPPPTGPPPPFYPLGGPPNGTIGGRPALLSNEHNGQSTAAWFLDDAGTVATVYYTKLNEPLATAERIARSMVPDDVGGVETALRLGWVPPEIDLATSSQEVTVSDIGRGPLQLLRVGDPGIWVRLAPNLAALQTDLTNDAPATVRGRPGQASARSGYGQASVQLANGQYLAVLCYTGRSNDEYRDNALRVANELIIGPDPYVGWIGQR